MKTLGLLFGIGALLAQVGTASAQERPFTHPTLRLEPGFAVGLTEPQSNLYGAGGAASAKVDFNLTPWFDVFSSVEVVELTKASTYGVGGLWGFGAGARLKRPHNIYDNAYWNGASPWVDADLQYINTGGLNRFGWSGAIGLESPLDDSRHHWVGPFLRVTDVTDGTSVGGTMGHDNRDAWICIFGLTYEYDPAGNKKPAAPALVKYETPEAHTPVVTAPPPETTPDPRHNKIVMQQTRPLTGRVQFDFDSSTIHDDDKSGLSQLAVDLLRHLQPSGPQEVSFRNLEVDGHASDEGHAWAEEHNNKLAEARAQAVADFLVAEGVPRDHLTVKGFGLSKPVDDNSTEAGRTSNRRVEFELTITYVQDSTDGAK